MKTRKITTAFVASVAALLFGTVAAFGAEPRVWTNSRGEVALRGTLDVERTLDETPGVEAPNRVYFIDATGDLYSFRYRHLSEADRALVDEALDEPAPPKKVGTRRDVAPPLGTPVRTTPLGIPASRPRAEANPDFSPLGVSPKSDAPVSSKRPATVRVKIKLVDATGAPIPRAWFQGKILGGAATTSLSAHSDEDGGFTLALTPGVEYEALVTAPRGGSAVFYDKAKFRAPEANFDAASLTLNVGEGKEMKLTDRAAQEMSNEFRPEDEERLEAAPLDDPPSADATSRNGKTAAFETKTAMKLKFVDASGAPIPKITAQVQRIKRPSPTHWWRSDSGEGVYTIDLTPGEYEARATAWRGNGDVIYAGTTFTVGQGNGEPVELTVNVGKIIKPVDEAKPTEPASNGENAEVGATLGTPVLGEASLTTLGSAELASSLDSSPAKSTDGGALLKIPTTTLKVVDADGNPVPNAKIDFKERGADGGAGHLTADEQGVQIIRILGGAYDATVTTANGRSEFLSFNIPREEDAVVELKISGEAKPAVELKSTENASSDDEAESSATLGSAARRSNAVESREKTTIKVVDSAGKPVPFAVVEASQVVQEGELTVCYDLRADGEGVVSAPLLRGVEYEATVRADVPKRVLEEGETGLVGLVAKKYEGLRFYVPEGTGEHVVVLTLIDDA
ncbi:MAG: hypothetical protein IJ387_00890 [Thermoguttaceae bacterium]|nr:hypothetical protein [Thermoguttaceae bacterium]